MKELIQLLKEIRPDVDFENNTALIDQGVLDSLDIMEIVAEITDRFDVSISPADIVTANFNSAAALWAMIEKLK